MKRAFPCAAVVVFLCGAAFGDVRAMNGWGNNQTPGKESWGMTGGMLKRTTSGAHYADGLGMMVPHANPRAVSNAVSAQTAAGLGNARKLSSMAWQWGQFIDHDFALVDESAEVANIAIPMGDPMFDPGNTGTQTMHFTRSAHTGGLVDARQHSNVITHWIDGSMVYGSDDTRATALRGTNGKLLTSAGDMLPYNTMGLPNAMGPNPTHFAGGDVRANEQTGLTAMHTLFVREHNRLADAATVAHPTWDSQQIYDYARRMVGAEIQAITYNEWLPAMMGGNGLGSYAGYDASIDPHIDTAFSTAAFRIGHTMLNDQLQRFNEDGSVYAGGHLNLFQAFFQPTTCDTPEELDAVIRGLARQESNEIDTQAIDGVRNLLFGPGMGRDLIATNLQRGVDHGIPDYNALRQDMGLPAITSFNDITSDTALATALASVYSSVNEIDAWIGLMAEDHVPGASMGETLVAIFNDQFGRLRDGDRFFYLNDDELTLTEKDWLSSLSLADIIRLNSDIVNIQDNVFFVPAPSAGVLAVSGLLLAARRRRRA